MFVKFFLLILLLNYCVGALISLEFNMFKTCNATQNCIAFQNCTKLYDDYNANKIDAITLVNFRCGKNLQVCCEQTVVPTSNRTVDSSGIDLLPKNCGKQFNTTVNDNNAMSGEFPFLVGLMVKINSTKYTLYCSGFIITEMYIVSTAECTKYKNYIIEYIWLGLHNLQQQCSKNNESICDSYLEDIEEIVIHPEYKPPKYINDIALIRLKNQIEFKNTIQPICLPNNDLPNLDKAVFVGWGINGIITVMKLPNKYSMEIIDNKKCLNDYLYKPNTGYFCGKFTPTFSSCDADIGSPIMYKENNQMYAYGLITGDISICYNYIHNRKDYSVPEIYPTISIYKSWIIQNLKP